MQYWNGKNFIKFSYTLEIGEMHKSCLERQMFLLQNHTANFSCFCLICCYNEFIMGINCKTAISFGKDEFHG